MYEACRRTTAGKVLGTMWFKFFTKVSYRMFGTDFRDKFRQVSGFRNASDLAI